MKTDLSPLTLENAPGTAAKISLNMLHKDPNLTIFTLPIEGVELVEQQLDAFLGKYTFRSWFEQRLDGSWHPMGWWKTLKGEWYLYDDEFYTDSLTLVLRGGKKIEFETQKADDTHEDDIPAAKITGICLRARSGGITELCFHLQIRPGLGNNNLAIQENQHGPVLITLGRTSVAPKKGKQQSLPLEPGKGNTTPLDGSHLAQQLPNQSADGTTQANQTGSGEASAEASAAVNGNAGESGGEHPDPDATNGTADDPETDLARFAAGATKAAEEFKTLAENGGAPIDGRSERVKHEDRQRARGSRRVQ